MAIRKGLKHRPEYSAETGQKLRQAKRNGCRQNDGQSIKSARGGQRDCRRMQAANGTETPKAPGTLPATNSADHVPGKTAADKTGGPIPATGTPLGQPTTIVAPPPPDLSQGPVPPMPSNIRPSNIGPSKGEPRPLPAGHRRSRQPVQSGRRPKLSTHLCPCRELKSRCPTIFPRPPRLATNVSAA